VTPLLLTALFAAQIPSMQMKDTRDPARVIVAVEDLKGRGFAIAQAKQLASATVYALKQRVGQDAVVYEGNLWGQRMMVKKVGDTPSGDRAKLINYYEAAMAAAKYRVKVKFGKKRKKQYVTLSCRKAGEKKPLDEVKLTDKEFSVVFAEAKEKLKTFCPALAPPPPPEAVAPKTKKAPKPWSPPPRRD
jgi:hypothetical protein